jgi:hypothetical protein
MGASLIVFGRAMVHGSGKNADLRGEIMRSSERRPMAWCDSEPVGLPRE